MNEILFFYQKILLIVILFRLSCSILTSDLKLVAAGSLDSLIYLWERPIQQSIPEKTDILHSIGKINPINFTSSVQGNNSMEL